VDVLMIATCADAVPYEAIAVDDQKVAFFLRSLYKVQKDSV